MEPKIISGGIFIDERGVISFVNDFKLQHIERFYIINNSETAPVRGWQGHKLDHKFFYCVQGEIRVHFVKIDNWEAPSKNLAVKSHVLKATESAILHLPNGYANAIESLEKNAKLISFATLPLSKAGEDDVRFDINMWPLDER